MSKQMKLMETVLKEPMKYSPLVIISSNGIKKKHFLRCVSTKTGWQVMESAEIVSDIVSYIKEKTIEEWKEMMLGKPALIINNLNFLKARTASQAYLFEILSMYKKPVILIMRNLEGFSEDMFEFLSVSAIVHLDSNSVIKLPYYDDIFES